MNAWGIVLALVGFIVVYRVFVSPPASTTAAVTTGAAAGGSSTGTFEPPGGTKVGGVSHPGQVAA